MSDGQDETKLRRIVALENDLFFAVKIQDTLNRAGFLTRVTRTVSDFRALLLGGGYTLALVNTAARGIDWRAGVAAAREAGVPVIAYGPHVDLDTQAEARAAGVARVIANSRLTELPALVERVIARAGGQAPQPDGDAEGSNSSVPRSGDQSDEQTDS